VDLTERTCASRDNITLGAACGDTAMCWTTYTARSAWSAEYWVLQKWNSALSALLNFI